MPEAIKDIRIEPYPPERGRKAILIDGVRWGTIRMSQHGSRGSSFWFEQEGGQQIGRLVPSPLKGKPERFAEVRVYGDKMQSRISRLSDPTPKPVADRLLDAVKKLIAEGLLKDPAIVKEERDVAKARFQAGRAESEAADLEERRKRAREILLIHAGAVRNNDNLIEALADEFKRQRSL